MNKRVFHYLFFFFLLVLLIVQVAYKNRLAVVEEDHSLYWPLLGVKKSRSVLSG